MDQLESIYSQHNPEHDLGTSVVTITDLRLARVLGDALVGIGQLHQQVAGLQRRIAVLEQSGSRPVTSADGDDGHWLDAMTAAGWKPKYDRFGHLYALHHTSGARIEGSQVNAWHSLRAVPPALVWREGSGRLPVDPLTIVPTLRRAEAKVDGGGAL